MGVGSYKVVILKLMDKAIFLDRDGVINRAIVRDGRPYPPSTLQDVEILSGVREALSKLRAQRWQLIVVTNQPDVARGATMRETVEEINKYLDETLGFDAVYTCYHDMNDGCSCRKPLPGSLLKAAEERGLILKNCYMIGDRWRDIEAGQRAGCKTVFIDYGYNERRPENADYVVQSLLEASKIILTTRDKDFSDISS